MKNKPYYSVRTGKHDPPDAFGLDVIKKLVLYLYEELEREGYFQEHFGFRCVDSGFIPGTFGSEPGARILLEIGKTDIWEMGACIDHYSEDDLFDVIELLFEYVSKPTKRTFHSWSDCGWHCSEFDRDSGRKEFRDRVNEVLPKYSPGFVLCENGEIRTLPDSGMGTLEGAGLPIDDPENVTARVDAAKRKFHARGSTVDDRRDAISDLAAVLEFLRPQVKAVLESEDENDLFNIANNFGIRHHNQRQKTNYDRAIWYSWMYYYYLATIHAAVRLIEKNNSANP